MNKTDRIENEYLKAINANPCNSSLYNDYAIFLSKYRKDNISAVKYLNRAIKFSPDNAIYKSNLNKIIKQYKAKNQVRYTIFLIFLISVMLWIGYEGYTNFMNIFSLFVLAQVVLQSKKQISYRLTEKL